MARANAEMPTVTVVSGNIASLAVFNQGDNFEIFEERIEQYLLANAIQDTKKVAVLLTLVSEPVYKVLKNLCDPAKPKDGTYEELIELLSEQYRPRVSIYRRRIAFDNLKQGSETVNQWYIRIKDTASLCGFGGFGGRMLEERVKDKFVVGMKPGPIQDKLCEEALTKALADLLEMALNKEAALLETREAEIHSIRRRKVSTAIAGKPLEHFVGKAGKKSTGVSKFK